MSKSEISMSLIPVLLEEDKFVEEFEAARLRYFVGSDVTGAVSASTLISRLDEALDTIDAEQRAARYCMAKLKTLI